MGLGEKYGGVMQRQGLTLQAVYRKIEGQDLLESLAGCDPDKDGPCVVPAVGASDIYGVIQPIGFFRIQIHKRGPLLRPANAAPLALPAFPGQEEPVVPGKTITLADQMNRAFPTAWAAAGRATRTGRWFRRGCVAAGLQRLFQLPLDRKSVV